MFSEGGGTVGSNFETGSITINDAGGNDTLVIHQFVSSTDYLDMMTFTALAADGNWRPDDLEISFDVTGSTNPFTITVEDYFDNTSGCVFWPAGASAGTGAMESLVISGSSYIPEAYEGYDPGPEIVLDFSGIVALL